MLQKICKRFEESAQVLRDTREHLADRLVQAAEIIIASYRQGGRVFLFGNGGSAADAQHIAGELVGRFLKERRGLGAVALSCDTSILTAIGNDYGFDRIFARQIEASARAGDVAVALSTSGNSPNVLAGLTQAREMGLKTIALTGSGGGKCAPLADVLLDAACEGSSPRIQEAHVVLYHILCELVEDAFADGV